MSWTPFDWFSQHWQQITGWAVLIALAYKIFPIITRTSDYLENLEGIEETRADLKLIMTNHLPHLQNELEQVNTNISGLRTDVKEGLDRLSNTLNVVLSRID